MTGSSSDDHPAYSWKTPQYFSNKKSDDSQYNADNEPLPVDVREKMASELLGVGDGRTGIKQTKKCVLGLDIYEYSQYSKNVQVLIPVVFDVIYDHAARLCKRYEAVFFENHDFRSEFVHTGDGGYLIFDTPLHGVIFASYFYAILRLVNSGRLFSRIKKIVGQLVIRCAVSYDHVFKYRSYQQKEATWFGAAFVTNNRMLSKDRLNRCLVDELSYQWFLKEVNGIESLSTLDVDNIGRIIKRQPSEVDYDSYVFATDNRHRNASGYNHFCSADIQKIGAIRIKKNDFSIYNVQLKVRFWPHVIREMLRLSHQNDTYESIYEGEQPMVISVGNLNVAGIE